MNAPTDLILLQAQWSEAVPGQGLAPRIDADSRSFVQTPAVAPLIAGLRRLAHSARAGAAEVYLYLQPSAAFAFADLPALAEAYRSHCAWSVGVRASRLEQVFDTAGASAGMPVRFHYAVEMDPDSGWMPEIARWYDTEHMPGLAAVPGCVRATRFLNHGHGPLSLACYDLVNEETLGSPPWLAVRATAWSDITRPHFTHTKRTMFRVPGAP